MQEVLATQEAIQCCMIELVERVIVSGGEKVEVGHNSEDMEQGGGEEEEVAVVVEEEGQDELEVEEVNTHEEDARWWARAAAIQEVNLRRAEGALLRHREQASLPAVHVCGLAVRMKSARARCSISSRNIQQTSVPSIELYPIFDHRTWRSDVN